MLTGMRWLHGARQVRQYVCACQPFRAISSLPTTAPSSDVPQKRREPTIDIHFPWQVTPNKNFPRSLRPLKLKGCGRFSKYASISMIAHYTNMYIKEPFKAAQFRENAAATIVSFADAVDKMDVAMVNDSCVGELRKLIVTFLSVAKYRTMDFRLHLMNVDNVQLSGGNLIFFHNRFKIKEILNEGMEAALFRHPLVRHPIFPFITYFGERVEVLDQPAKALLVRIYVTFSTEEVYKIMQGSTIVFGDHQAQKSMHVATFERIIPCLAPGSDGYFDPEPWYLTDLDSTVLKLQQTAKNRKPAPPVES